jgi:hypothetical protein
MHRVVRGLFASQLSLKFLNGDISYIAAMKEGKEPVNEPMYDSGHLHLYAKSMLTFSMELRPITNFSEHREVRSCRATI